MAQSDEGAITMDWGIISSYWDLYMQGTWVTFKITFLSIIISTVIGYVLALMRLSSVAPLRGMSFLYVWFFRGLPVLLLLFFFYYTMPFGLKLDAFTAAIIGISISSAAFKAEIIRSGIMSVDKGHLEAAEALGMNPLQKMGRITIPRTFRLLLPPYISNSVIMVKESALVSIITVQDLMFAAQRAFNNTFKVAETLGVAGMIYLTVTTLLMLVQYVCEKKMRTGV
jgi:polar amino acid transport system permease protein